VSVSAWEAFFFVVVLKIPVIYLAAVVWWAVRAVPEHPEGGDGAAILSVPSRPCGWDDWKRSRPGRRRPVRPVNPSRRRARAVGG
jgi:hypothetical protein